ncbi:hypothetical protein DAI22_06g008601 [Oryza sativa Japonica Group]|nr:hypothetical protein DAI22_06g008601 [Oryza sativa Japonica Group]
MPSNTSVAWSTAPHLAYMSSSALPTTPSALCPILPMYACNHLPVSSAPSCAHAPRAATNVASSGRTAAACISWNSASASSSSPARANADIIVFQETTFFFTGILLNHRCAAAASPHLAYMSTSAFHATTSIATFLSATRRCASRPSARSPICAHAENAAAAATASMATQRSSAMAKNSTTASSKNPCLAWPVTMAVQETTSRPAGNPSTSARAEASSPRAR